MNRCSGVRSGTDDRASRPVIVLATLLLSFLSPTGDIHAQNSFPLSDLMPLARGGSLGGQALAGDLLAVAIDPTVAAGEHPGIELAGGSHILDLKWAAAGARIRFLGYSMAVGLATLSYGSQYRTEMDDRVGLFRSAFTPSDLNLSIASLLLDEEQTTIGAGLTFSTGRIDEYTAFGISGAVAARQSFGDLQLRGGLSNLGTALSPYGKRDGTRVPARLRAGMAFPFNENRWEFSSELLYRFGDDNNDWSVGMEWRPMPDIALRLGILQSGRGAPLYEGGLFGSALTGGFSCQFSDWRISYSYRQGGAFGGGHLVAVGWGLGSVY